jgi:spore maturation protein CgeB
MKRLGLLTPGWDWVFMKDRVAVEKLRRVGCNAQLLFEAMNPAWHKPLAAQSKESVAVAGNWYGYRQALVLRLMRSGVSVRLFGSKLPRWAFSDLRGIHPETYLVQEAKSRAFGEALACLNSMQFSEGDSINCRAFEIAGAGGLQLIEHRPSIAECFEPGRELLVFRTFEELLEHIEWARRSPREALQIRSAGAKRAVAEHTYEHRLRAMFRAIGVQG